MEKNKPQIRFKGFIEDLPLIQLGKICVIGDINHRMPPTVSYGIPYLMTGDFIGLNELDFENAKLISNEDYDELSKKIKPEFGDILFARYASIGDVRYVESNKKFLISYSCAIIKKSDFIFEKYLYYYFQNNKIQNQIELEINTGSQRNIGIDSIRKLNFKLPKENEQQKISTYFENIDKLITEHQKKLGKLKALKKAMLSKMFPKPGQTVPEIRFKGFTGDWEEKALNKIAIDISDGNWIEANHIFEEGEYRIIQTGNLGIGIFLDKSNNAKYFHQKDFDEVRGNEIFPGDILISRLAEPAGRTIILPSTGFRMVTAVDVTIIRPNDLRFDSTFLMTQLNTENILKVINENVSGTSHRRISRKNLEKTKLIIPILEEQRKIGEYFKNLDELIQNNILQIEKLQNLKKAFLAKMFI